MSLKSQSMVTQSDGADALSGYGASEPFQMTQGSELTQDGWTDEFFTGRPQSSGKPSSQVGGPGRLAGALDGLRLGDGFDDEDGQEQEPLPEHACRYCGVRNPASVVKCLTTGKWFCNGRANKSGSCIVLHLVKSKCKEVQLHKDSPLGDAILECYASGTRNVFVLGFVPVKSENTVVLLARDTPANHPTIKDLNLDMSQWQPIIENRALVSWLVKPPTTRELAKAQRLTWAQISKLEECWMRQPDATLEDVERTGNEDDGVEVIPVALRYTDVHQYNTVFKLLVKLEADYDRAMKESQARDNINIRWDWGLNHKRMAYFFFPKDDVDLRLMPGDELRLKHRNASNRGPWEGSGTVLRFDQTEEVCLEMSSNDVPDDCTVGFRVEFVWKSTSFDRMRAALKQLDQDRTSISGYLYHTLLGHEVEPAQLRTHQPRKGLSVPNMPDLNHSQLAALKSVLTSPLSLIQGPPGTGKTVTSAAIVYHIVQACKRPDEPCVLVAAPSNVAVDQMADKISQTGLKVVRLCAKSREDVLSPCEHLTLHYQVRHVDLPGADLFRKLLQLKEDQGGLRVEDEKQLFMLRRRLEMEILEAADVVCCTCVGSGDPRLKGFRFQHVLIDEATQAAEPECLIPMLMGAKQVVLVGDHCQLGPVIMCKKAAEAGLSQSLFERLRLLGIKPIRLQVQYRMHPCLSEFPSNMFYEGTLQNGAGVGDRLLPGVDFPWPNPDKPMMFYSQLGAEEISASGTSFLNRTEAANVEKIVTRLLQNGLKPSQIGVITPYEGQRAHVVSVMLRNGTMRSDLYMDVEVSSVDAFQGREKDVIVLSCVRSNEQQSVGFLGDPRRLNVALTRARFGVVVLGNPRVLCKQALWNALLTHYKEQGCLVEGPLNNLKPSMVQLSKPLRRFDRSSFGIGVLTTNRYQPPERVGDTMPSKAIQLQGEAAAAQAMADRMAGATASGVPGKQKEDGRGKVGAPPGQPAAAAAAPAPAAPGASQASQKTGLSVGAFMPFATPNYAIPSLDPRKALGTPSQPELGPGPITQVGMASGATQATQLPGTQLPGSQLGAAATQAGLHTQLPGLHSQQPALHTQLGDLANSQLGLGLQPPISQVPGAYPQDTGLHTQGPLFSQDGLSAAGLAGVGGLVPGLGDAGSSLLDEYGMVGGTSQYDSLLLSQQYGGGAGAFVDPTTGETM